MDILKTTQRLWVFLLFVFHGCAEDQALKTINLSTISSTDTIYSGAPSGMYLYMNKAKKFNLDDMLKQKGYSTNDLASVRLNQIKIKVERPESSFKPASFGAFNTSFSQKGTENLVIETDDFSYQGRTYTIENNDEIQLLKKNYHDFKVSGGVRIAEKLEHTVVLKTIIALEAQVKE